MEHVHHVRHSIYICGNVLLGTIALAYIGDYRLWGVFVTLVGVMTRARNRG